MRFNRQLTLSIALLGALQLLGVQSKAQDTPSIPTNGLLIWLKGDVGVVPDSAQPNNVTTWQDQSGNGYNVSQTTETSEPTVGSGCVTFNGSQWLTFPPPG